MHPSVKRAFHQQIQVFHMWRRRKGTPSEGVLLKALIHFTNEFHWAMDEHPLKALETQPVQA